MNRYQFLQIGQKTLRATSTALVALWLCVSGCSRQDSSNAERKNSSAQGPSNDGVTLTLSAEQAKRFETIVAQSAAFVENLRASARAIAAAIPEEDTNKPLVIFETSEISQLYSDYVKNKAVHARAETQLARIKELQANSAASGKDALDAQTEHNQAEAALRESESRLLQLGLKPKQISSMRPGTVLMMCDVPEAKINGVSMGEEAEFEFNAFPNERFHGRVTSLGSTIDPQTRTVKVGIELSSHNGKIKPGMFARVGIEERSVNAMSVPREAVVNADAKTFVFVKMGDSVFERRAVVIGADNGKAFQILSGLRDGEKVVVTNAILLKGMSFGY